MVGLVPAIHVFRIVWKTTGHRCPEQVHGEGTHVLTRLAALAVAAVLVHGGLADAQEYPNRPVKVVVPFPAGGGTDALTRFAIRGMEQRLGQPFTSTGPVPCGRSFSLMMPRRLATSV